MDIPFHIQYRGAALALRYRWCPTFVPFHCACGQQFSVSHALSCHMGGYPSIRHKEIRDLTADLLSEVCHSVSIEPLLQPAEGEALRGASANVNTGARLDIAASCYRQHENAKKRAYEKRIREVEHGSFVPLVLSVTGLRCIATITYKRLASLLSSKMVPTVFHHYGVTPLQSIILSSSSIHSCTKECR